MNNCFYFLFPTFKSIRQGKAEKLCGLRRGSAAARLLRLWFRIPPRAPRVCCQVEVSATSWSLVQRSPTECGVSKEKV
jgi:hypothetical protein